MPKNISGHVLYTIDEVAEKFGIKPSTVRHYIRKGRLRKQKIGGEALIPEDSYNDFLEARSPQPANETKRNASVITFANHKGGVGKTTTALNVSVMLSLLKKKTLVIDVDPQANLTEGFGFNIRPENTLYEAFTGNCKFKESFIQINSFLDLCPADIDMAVLELNRNIINDNPNRLNDLIKTVKSEYDYIVLDSPPGLGIFLINSLVACNVTFINITPEYYPYKALMKFISYVKEIRMQLNSDLSIGGIILTRFVKRKVISREVLENINANYADLLLNTRIRENIELSEASANGVDIFKYNKSSNGAKDYEALTKEILKLI